MAGRQSTYAKQYRSTPKGAAACAWNRLTSRAGAKYNFGQCYADVEVRMTREEFMEWAVPQYAAWFRDHPDEKPSIDRKDSNGHYEIGNLQLIEVEENRRKNSRRRAEFAPPGTRWCSDCQTYVSLEQFYPLHVHPWYTSRCKACTHKDRKPGRRASAPPGMGWCSGCQAYLPLTDFHPLKVTKKNPFGYSSDCKTCRVRKNRERLRRKQEPNNG